MNAEKQLKKTINIVLISMTAVFLLLTMASCAIKQDNNTACLADTKNDGRGMNVKEFDEKWEISRTAETAKVILDVDLKYVNDDAYAALIAAQADALGYIDLLGVTATSCNTFAAASAYDTLYLFQTIDRNDIPVYLGESEPGNGLLDIEKYKKVAGLSAWFGCYATIDRYTEDISEAYELGLCGAPGKITNASIQNGSGVDFIIEQVHKYPGEVTLFSLASLTTIAKAIEKDSTVVDDAAGIIIMGGDFGARIDDLRDYEINFWFDPEASNMVLNAPWKEKIIVSSDAAESCKRNRDVYEMIKSKNNGKAGKCIVDSLAPAYENGKEEDFPYCWDSITIVYYLCPDIMTKIESRAVCVDERDGLTYGLTRDWSPGTEPVGVNVHDIVFKCDGKVFWDFVSDICSVVISK